MYVYAHIQTAKIRSKTRMCPNSATFHIVLEGKGKELEAYELEIKR